MSLSLIFLIVAFVLSVIEAFASYFPALSQRPQLGWLALAFFFLSVLVGK
jgi:hypothetical protein